MEWLWKVQSGYYESHLPLYVTIQYVFILKYFENDL
jgi:hypothetical protein